MSDLRFDFSLHPLAFFEPRTTLVSHRGCLSPLKKVRGSQNGHFSLFWQGKHGRIGNAKSRKNREKHVKNRETTYVG